MTTSETKPETFEYAIEAARYATHGKETMRTHAVRAWLDRIERAHAAGAGRVPEGWRDALVRAEAALADIGDADREPGDDVAWCERRAAEALPIVRALLSAAPAPDPKPADEGDPIAWGTDSRMVFNRFTEFKETAEMWRERGWNVFPLGVIAHPSPEPPPAEPAAQPAPSDAPASPQAAQGDASVSAADVSIESYPEPPAGGMTFGVPRGVKATHRPTGCVAIVTHHRSQHVNRDAAIAALSAAIAKRRPAAQAETGAAGSAQGDLEALARKVGVYYPDGVVRYGAPLYAFTPTEIAEFARRLASTQPNSSATLTGSDEFKVGDRVEWVDSFGRTRLATVRQVFPLKYRIEVDGVALTDVLASSLTRLTGGSHD